MTKEREKAEAVIYKFFDALDPTGSNTKFYKELFVGMSDTEFKKFCSRIAPFRLQTQPFKYEPTVSNIMKSFKVIDVPFLEDVYEPHLYTNEKGEAVTCTKALTAYVNLVALKQMLAKKNSWATENAQRESKTGRLTSHDKAGLVSDRETESFFLFDQFKTLDFFTHEMGDDMDAKSQMLAQINATGQYHQDDVSRNNTSQISKNTVDAYFIGSCLMTNLINKDYMTPYTMSCKQKNIKRET